MKSDMELKKHVEEELQWEPKVEASHIGVIVNDGVVTLNGSVDNFPAKWEAEEAVLRVAGVKAVANEIEVTLPGENLRTDEDIARLAWDVLEWNTTLPKNNDLQVAVEDGWITLTGHVEWQYQKKAAESVVRPLTGVKGITNNIVVKPRETQAAVKENIHAALDRNAALKAKEIRVTVDGSTVTLEGTVSSWAEKQAAESAAWLAPGVTRVNNNLVVND